MRRPSLAALGYKGLTVLALLGMSADLAAAPGNTGPVRCFARHNGPCTVADSFDFAWNPAGTRWAAMLNFGLVTGGPGLLQLTHICEEAYQRNTPERLLIDESGWVHIPGPGGVRRAHLDSICAWQLASGFPAGTVVLNLARDPSGPARLFALVSVGTTQWLYHSSDGGAHYAARSQFPRELQLFRLHTTAGAPAQVLATGFGRVPGRFAFVRSTDFGQTFTTHDPVPAFPETNWINFLLELAPDAPDRWYFARSTPLGTDELWVSEDAGQTARRLQALLGGQILTGLVHGPRPGEIFMAGTELLERESTAPGHLYHSLDRGETWETPIPSGAHGPRFRCLAERNGVLYACGAGSDLRDRFLIGASHDQGRSWQTLLAIETLPPPHPCVAALCPETATWLCDAYTVCAPPLPPRQGCSCAFGRTEALSPPVVLAFLGMFFFTTARRAHKRSTSKAATSAQPLSSVR